MGGNQLKDVIFVGKPNSGKSSLFNQLTGLNQKVGNYAGVTVEKKTGNYKGLNLIDLPGLHSLDTNTPEELISKKKILSMESENSAIVYVANGTQLIDSLLLFSQIADLQIPMVLVINFKDELAKNKIEINLNSFKERLGCPILLMNSKSGDGIEYLKAVLEGQTFNSPNTFCRSQYDTFDGSSYQNNYKEQITENTDLKFWEEDYKARLRVISSVVKDSVNTDNAIDPLNRARSWDKILLHPIFGLLIFLFVLFVVFQAVFSLSSYPMDWIDAGMANLSNLAKNNISVPWLSDLISDAIIPGIGGVIIFIPQIAILFFLLGLLEHSGYLSRISFLSDSFLKRFGLSGHSIIPLMSSWACSIPAIMSTRIIADPKERLTVIFASPLMTCSARLPVYTILIAVIFPSGAGGIWGVQGLALLSLYLLGIVATLVVSYIVNKNLKVESNPFWAMELPVFRMPNWNNIFINVYQKTKSFVVQAGKIILGISIVLWLLASFSPHNENFKEEKFQEFQKISQKENSNFEMSKEAVDLEYSYLGYMGKIIEPAIRPLGYDWKIGIALLSSFAAREVFVGTLASIYSIGSEDENTIVERLRNEKNPETGKPRYDFATAVSLLLFYVFALQCMSTLAIVKKETGSTRLMLIQFLFMLVLAYVFAFAGYHLLK